MDKATLLLSDGSRYAGRAFGAPVEAAGELAFNTGVIDCVESLTNPACAGKLVVFTFPDIGGHGVIPEDFHSPWVRAAGVIVRGRSEHPSNRRSKGNLDGLLREQGIPGICGIDTRALMIRMRGGGALTGRILRDGGDAAGIPAAPPIQLPNRSARYAADGPAVTVLDAGCGDELARRLHARGADVTLVPLGFDCAGAKAVAISDGPEEAALAAAMPRLPSGVPIYAEGVGHLLLAKARGGGVSRMRARHGGANLPVRRGGKVYITEQFHAYAVSEPPRGAEEIMYNLNDDTVEAILYGDAISVQFPPSVDKGPHDMGWLYDRFLAMAGASA